MKLIHELITEYAGCCPEKTALSDPDGKISYGEFEKKTAYLCARLSALGFSAGDAAAVYVPYTKDIMTGAFSVLRSGGVYIPFDDAYPAERLEYMLKDSEAQAILTVHELWEKKKLDFPEDRVIFMDDPSETDDAECAKAVLNEDSPAMLLYTSGTTGNPKGVLHTHRMLLHIADWIDIHEDAAMDGNTCSGVMSSFSFVGSCMFLFGPLRRGGSVCFAPDAARKDLGFLYQFLKDNKITHIFLPSSLAAILAEDYDISGMYIFAAGEKLRNFRPHTKGSFLINSYGSTELSGVLSKKIFGDEERILIGRASSDTKTLIADEDQRPVEPGNAGELLISTSHMSRRYWKMPELTAQKWIQIEGVTWFRTGDRAVCTPEGDFELLGRTDNMIKLRGFRIETGEVEARIGSALEKTDRTGVGQIVVTVKTVGGSEKLVCYYEAKQDLDSRAVEANISEHLAPYMIPDLWVRVDAMPRNANGKVMRNELPLPRIEKQVLGALDSEVTARVLWTVADVLGIDFFISPDDRFTDLGGTSLTSMKLASALREQGIRISSSDILKLNVLDRIAKEADVAYEQFWSQKEYEAVKKDFADRGERIRKVLPVSARQDEMLFMELLHPDRPDSRYMWFLLIDSPVSEEDMRKALDVISEENEELRSSVVFHDVSVIQQVVTDRKIPLRMMEIDSFGADEMAKIRKQFFSSPIDLQRDSLMNAGIVHTPDRNFIILDAHSFAFTQDQVGSYVKRIMEVLEKKYPEDISIRDWLEVLEFGALADENENLENTAIRKPELLKKEAPGEICIYSENSGPKLFFVHTGNTGSEAYYRLAARIGNDISFAVVEPFNLYHPKEAVYGIKNIAANYIRIIKTVQPEGPYLLGGWCYGGVVAHEMACQLEKAGDKVLYLFMLDSHALGNEKLRGISKGMFEMTNRDYFETCPLFAELRENGMLDAIVNNAAHVSKDLFEHVPSFFDGNVIYFKPEEVPAGISGDNLEYWKKMMEFDAGNYENYCSRDKLTIIHTPHEHDLMMDDVSLDIIAPKILEATLERKSENE